MTAIKFELRQLRHLLAVAELGGFRPAAERLFISQPALSVSIRKLEQSLGVDLLHRGPPVALTDAGRVLLPEFARIVAHAERSQHDAALLGRGEAGTVRVGFVGSAVYRLLPRVLPPFRRSFPQVRLELSEGTTATLLPMLSDGAIDVAFVRQPFPPSPDLRVMDLEADELVAVLPRGHRLADRKQVRIEELADQPFIIFSRRSVPGLHDAVTVACQRGGFAPRIEQEVTQAATLIGLVGSGLGVALAPGVIAEIAGAKVAFVKLAGIKVAAPLMLSMVALTSHAAPAVQSFWEHISSPPA